MHGVGDPGVGFLEDARSRAHERRGDDGEVVHDLVNPPVQCGREPDLQRQGEQYLAQNVRKGQPEVLQVVLAQNADGVNRCRFISPAVMRQAYSLGPTCGSGGVDERGQMRRLNCADPLV